ncbi:MAG: ribosome-associated translation inhibitor RaiA [Dermatophilaceae bacterium]
MDLVVTGRHIQLSDRFRAHVADRLGKVEQLAPRTLRVDVLVTHEPNPRQAKASERVEVTCHARGPVIRAEACHDDKYAAFEMAMDKLTERLRRAGDKRRVSRGRRTPESVAAATGRISPPEDAATASASVDAGSQEERDLFGAVGDSPIEVREKVHASAPMTLSDALREMELVGHDFFLFVDSETRQPSVVYRRRGWNYGVIHLDVAATAVDSAAS